MSENSHLLFYYPNAYNGWGTQARSREPNYLSRHCRLAGSVSAGPGFEAELISNPGTSVSGVSEPTTRPNASPDRRF